LPDYYRKKFNEHITPIEKLAENINQIRESFLSSSTVIVECNIQGLGDAIMNLRYTFALARMFPEKQFRVNVPKSLLSLYLDRPVNVNLVTGNYLEMLDDFEAFYLAWDVVDISFMKATTSVYVPDEQKDNLMRLLTSGRISIRDNSFPVSVSYLESVLQDEYGVNLESCNQHDLRALLRINILFGYLSSESLDRSIMQISPLEILQTERKYDLMIVPEAKEHDVDNGNRSEKSISPEKWKDIFSLMKGRYGGKKIVIVKGHSHPRYVRAVYRTAKEVGLNVEFVNTRTLDDFSRLLLSSEAYIGMDTGPTHLAGEVAKRVSSLGVLGREIPVVQIFNGTLHSPLKYGVRGAYVIEINNSHSQLPSSDIDLYTNPEDLVNNLFHVL
jgi:hypothetical protein